MFEQLTTEGRLLRVLSAICKQNGGEIRLPLELVDSPGEATKLDFMRDRKTQELIVRGVKENEVLLESMRLKPEVQRAANVPIDTAAPVIPAENGHTKSSPGMTDEQLTDLEKKLQKRRIAAMMLEDLRQRKAT